MTSDSSTEATYDRGARRPDVVLFTARSTT